MYTRKTILTINNNNLFLLFLSICLFTTESFFFFYIHAMTDYVHTDSYHDYQTLAGGGGGGSCPIPLPDAANKLSVIARKDDISF